MGEMVTVAGLVGEVIAVSDERATIQVYEVTTGLKPGAPVERTGAPLSIELGPGLLSSIYDGIARRLDGIAAASGDFIAPGATSPTLPRDKKYAFHLLVRPGDELHPGMIYAECPETPSFLHRLPVPPDVSGAVTYVAPDGDYTVDEVLVRTDKHELRGYSLWPIRTPRPVHRRLAADEPLITGQRVIDCLFPITKGGTAMIPGGFGAGKTMLQHQLAKYSAADVIVYVGCGERGNEMTQVLEEFAELPDPRTGGRLLDRTVLIANTSNMPVAAREASIYTGVAIAEYFRDMGLHVAMMADSTSRWAEALREISGRLEEMPAEEGFPAYLPSRLAAFYERAGCAETLSGGIGSVTLIGAVSPQGADFSEPVTQNTKRFTRCFWALDKSLAYARHYPAVNWMQSYSEYGGDETAAWFSKNVAEDFEELRSRVLAILSEESSLAEIVRLIGESLLADEQKLTLETAKVLRTGFLQQNALDPSDASVPPRKQYLMMKAILGIRDEAAGLIAKKIPMSELAATGVFERLTRMKYETDNESYETAIPALAEELSGMLTTLCDKYA
jgi:V/A-type H+-transporting ATPase subunit A